MRDETLLKQVREVNRLRQVIDATGPTFPLARVKADVVQVYGRSVSRMTWSRWCQKCSVTAEILAQHGGEYPAGAYLLLMVNAKLSRGNGPKERSRKVTRPQLVAAVKAHRTKHLAASIGQLPQQLTADQLRGYAEAKANRSYHRRTHERNGIKKTQAFYSRAEAVQILDRYPTFSIGA